MPQAFPTKATWRVISATGSARRLESFGGRNDASQALVAFADQALPAPRRRRVPHEGIARSAQVCPAMPSVRSETNRGVSASSARSRSPRSFSPHFDHLSPTVAREAYAVFNPRPHTNLQKQQKPPRRIKFLQEKLGGKLPHRTGLRACVRNPRAQRRSLTMM